MERRASVSFARGHGLDRRTRRVSSVLFSVGGVRVAEFDGFISFALDELKETNERGGR